MRTYLVGELEEESLDHHEFDDVKYQELMRMYPDGKGFDGGLYAL